VSDNNRRDCLLVAMEEPTMQSSLTRRGFGRACAGLALGALALEVAPALAEDLPHVDENSPQAKALGYVHDAAAVDKAKFPHFADGSHCANCALYQGGESWGGCGIFPGQAVNAAGWCSAWAKKPA
jgi:hypothetical protein